MAFLSFKEKSKLNFGKSYEGDEPVVTNEQVQLGAILRIADATELMARRHQDLIATADYYQRRCNEECERVKARDKTIASLRGQITKLKKQLAKKAI